MNPGAGMTYFILSRETAKLGPGLRVGGVTHPTRDPRAVPARTCPRCGLPVEPADAAILLKRLTCHQQPIRAERAAGVLARALARLLLPAYPQAGTLAALVPDRILRLQAYGEPLANDAVQEITADTETAADPEADPAGAEGGARDDLAPAERQARWDAWAVHPDARGRTRLDSLLAQLATALAGALGAPAGGDSPVLICHPEPSGLVVMLLLLVKSQAKR